jgi:hypothetical protein
MSGRTSPDVRASQAIPFRQTHLHHVFVEKVHKEVVHVL